MYDNNNDDDDKNDEPEYEPSEASAEEEEPELAAKGPRKGSQRKRSSKMPPDVYKECLKQAAIASRKVTKHVLENSSKTVQEAFKKLFDKPTIPKAMTQLPKVLNTLSTQKWLPTEFFEDSFPLCALETKILAEPPKEKYNGDVRTTTKQFEGSRDTPAEKKFAEAFNALHDYIQTSAKLEAASITPLLPEELQGRWLQMCKAKKPNSNDLQQSMYEKASSKHLYVDMNPFSAYNTGAVVNAYQKEGVIPPSSEMNKEEKTEVAVRKKVYVKKMEKNNKKSNGKSSTRKKYTRRPCKPKKKYDPNASLNPVCIEGHIHGEKATTADILALKRRKLKPETARIKPVLPLTDAFCDAPWYRGQIKTGERSSPIPFIDPKSKPGKRSGRERTLSEKAAKYVHEPIPLPISLSLLPAAKPWDGEYPENYEQCIEEYEKFILASHDKYRSKEENNNWQDYNNQLQNQNNKPYNDHEIIQKLNLNEAGIKTLSQELLDEALEGDKKLANMLHCATIYSQ